MSLKSRGKSVKYKAGLTFKIDWGSIRSFPYDNGIIKILRENAEIQKLCEIGFSIPPTVEQEDTIRSLISKIMENTPRQVHIEHHLTEHLFGIVSALNSAKFVSSGSHLKKVWLCMAILGDKNQRKGGYTMKDIMEFARIEEKNRTLARNAAAKMKSLGLLKKIGGIGKQPRYKFTGEQTEQLEDAEILKETSDNLGAFSDMLGKNKKRMNLWEEYHGGLTVLGSITNFSDYILNGGTSTELEYFLELWQEWIGLLFDVLSGSRNEDPGEVLSKLFMNSALREKIKRESSNINIDRILELVLSDEWRGYMLIDLKTAIGSIQDWNWGNNTDYNGIYLNTKSTRLLQKKSSN